MSLASRACGRDDLVEWLLPATCASPNCDARLGWSPTLCPDCWADVPLWTGTRCRRCGTPAPASSEACRNCPKALGDDDGLRHVRAATRFAGAIREAIHLSKYDPRPRLARPLSHLIVTTGPPVGSWLDYAALVPVPLHRTRRAERGFCQATALSTGIAKGTGLSVERDWVRRTRPTIPMWQSGGLEGRRREIDGAFVADLTKEAAGRPLLLVDDAVTTGSTAGEVARMLRAAGSGPVDVVLVARAVRLPTGTFDDRPGPQAA